VVRFGSLNRRAGRHRNCNSHMRREGRREKKKRATHFKTDLPSPTARLAGLKLGGGTSNILRPHKRRAPSALFISSSEREGRAPTSRAISAPSCTSQEEKGGKRKGRKRKRGRGRKREERGGQINYLPSGVATILARSQTSSILPKRAICGCLRICCCNIFCGGRRGKGRKREGEGREGGTNPHVTPRLGDICV